MKQKAYKKEVKMELGKESLKHLRKITLRIREKKKRISDPENLKLIFSA